MRSRRSARKEISGGSSVKASVVEMSFWLIPPSAFTTVPSLSTTSPLGRRRTAPSTRSSPPAAARCRTRCISSAATRPCRRWRPRCRGLPATRCHPAGAGLQRSGGAAGKQRHQRRHRGEQRQHQRGLPQVFGDNTRPNRKMKAANCRGPGHSGRPPRAASRCRRNIELVAGHGQLPSPLVSRSGDRSCPVLPGAFDSFSDPSTLPADKPVSCVREQ